MVGTIQQLFYPCFIIVYLGGFPALLTAGTDDNNIQKLRTKLFNGTSYDKHVRPVTHDANTTDVIFNISPLYIIDMDEEKSLFSLDSRLILIWTDERLKWNPADFNGLKTLELPDHLVWQPDITVYNAHGGAVDPKQNTHLKILNSGEVFFVPPAVLQTVCPSHPNDAFGYYPRDEIICTITFGSWSQDGWQVNLTLTHSEMFNDEFQNINPRWELLMDKTALEHNVQNRTAGERYINVNAIFPLRRRFPPELQVVYIPCILIMTLSLVMFWIPPESGKKIILGSFLFLGLTLLIIYVAAITKSPSSPAKAVSFLQSTMYAIVSMMVLEIIVMNLCCISGPCRPPEFLVNLLAGPLGSVIAVWAPWKETTSADRVQLKEDNEQVSREPTPKDEWVLVATGIDRFLFVVYVVVMTAIHQV